MESTTHWDAEIYELASQRIVKERKGEIEKARLLIEFYFGMDLSMGDRMLLRGCFSEAERDFRIPHSAHDSFQPAREAAARYLLKYCSVPIQEVCVKVRKHYPYSSY